MATLSEPRIGAMNADTPQIGWLLIALTYLATAASMGMVGVAAALTADLGVAMHVARNDVGLALAMFSLPSAIGGVFCGGLVDRAGAKRVIVVSAFVCALGAGLAAWGASLSLLMLALAVSGVGFTGISVAAPALLVGATAGRRQVRAMSLWSTYAPTGFAMGLLLAAPFAGTGRWQPAFLIYGAIMLVLFAALMALPHVKTAAAPHWKKQLSSFASVFRERDVILLTVAVAVPSALSYGTSLIAPLYLAQVHGTSMGASATTVAAIKGVAMVLCGLMTGALLTRRLNRKLLFAGLAGLGMASQALLFWPGSGFALASLGLFGWLVAFSGMGAVAMAQLPVVVASPSRSGAASGLIGQGISVLSFLAPSIYFGMNGWMGFVAIACVGLIVAGLALPIARGRRPILS
ncbi:Sugar phosphate permease [Novosphingobium sp. CF614]|uniref:MFS transporter n=1 Tax=Novosphingobium sp. CF614 TaxID=1884364 RepID=UPI0008E94CE2|nr:MFS transporter [Novosphingobium sp. CF614]SFF79048.1 Sugar phosphate permease [Novosphingobium sp. CF614]